MSTIKIEPQHESEGTDDDFFDDLRGKWARMEAERKQTDEFKINNMEYDMSQAEWFVSKVRGSDNYAQNLYAALCNNSFQKQDVWLVLKDAHWSCSWRYAGGLVARIRGEGDYMDWYCSGIQDFSSDQEDARFYPGRHVSEGTVAQEIQQDLQKLGWIIVENQ